tara:strand:+ start:13051 stop:13401 length:351 start_codon:yes stop_codon:yes gene_type:complete
MSTTGRVSVNHGRLRAWIAENYGQNWRGKPTTSALDHFRIDLNKAGSSAVPKFRKIKTTTSIFYWLDTSRSPTTPKDATKRAIHTLTGGAVNRDDWTKIIHIIERYDLAGWTPPKI